MKADDKQELRRLTAWLAASGRAKAWQEAIERAGLFQRHGQRLDAISMNALCNACAKAGRWQCAMSLLAQELEQYTIVISALCGQSRPWTMALDLFASAKAVQGQQAQDVVLLSALLKAVPWRRGHELLREAHDVADRQLFNTAMCASASYRQWLLPICQLVVMAQKSLQPDVFSVSAAIDAQESNQAWARSVQLLCSLRAWGLQGDAVLLSVACDRERGMPWRICAQLLHIHHEQDWPNP